MTRRDQWNNWGQPFTYSGWYEQATELFCASRTDGEFNPPRVPWHDYFTQGLTPEDAAKEASNHDTTHQNSERV